MYITTEKSRGKWVIGSVILHTNFDTVIPVIRDEDGKISMWVYVYEIEPNKSGPTPMKKADIELMSGLKHYRL
jgi:hypothetical protein